MEINPIARFHSPFSTKFGIPKQSGLVQELEGKIVFEPDYRHEEALRGIDEFDFLWLIWEFSGNRHGAASLMVRPPLLGGNTKMGVFATRSPFRPNPLGLSSVRIKEVEWDTPVGPVIHVCGGDLMDGTPIYDIKPYIAYSDCHMGARSGFVDTNPIRRLRVVIPDDIARRFDGRERETLIKILELDPRPHYQNDAQKVYGMPFKDYDIHFTVSTDGVLTVTDLG
jgi:tRNA-Thr(GGU) m(6)t(6)A37 methyltransferase TsaA